MSLVRIFVPVGAASLSATDGRRLKPNEREQAAAQQIAGIDLFYRSRVRQNKKAPFVLFNQFNYGLSEKF